MTLSLRMSVPLYILSEGVQNKYYSYIEILIAHKYRNGDNDSHDKDEYNNDIDKKKYGNKGK